jgi:hypothetical protein
MTKDLRATSVQLAQGDKRSITATEGHKIGCSAAPSVAICPILKLIVMRSRCWRAEGGVSSPEPAVGVFTTAGTCQGRLRPELKEMLKGQGIPQQL